MVPEAKIFVIKQETKIDFSGIFEFWKTSLRDWPMSALQQANKIASELRILWGFFWQGPDLQKTGEIFQKSNL